MLFHALVASLLLLPSPASTLQESRLQALPGEAVPSLGWSSAVVRLHSEILGEDFRLFVGTPPSFARCTRSYPALYLLDGQYYFPEVLACVSALASTGAIPELVVIGIESRDRRRDFTPREIVLPDAGERARADRTLDFLQRELVPVAEAELRAGRPRVLLGHSHAGVLVLLALARRPETFPFGIELDAPVHLEHGYLAGELTRRLGAEGTPPVRLVSIARVFGWSDAQWTGLTARARPGDLLVRARIEDETHESMVFAATYRALKALFHDASALDARALAPLEIEARYDALATLYGAEVAPPEPLLRTVVEDFLMEGRGLHAGAWLERWTDTYGPPPDHDALARRVAEVAAEGEPTETVAGLLAASCTDPETLRPWLGTWRGTTGPANGPRNRVELRLWVADGSVQGELRHEDGPTMALEYLHVSPEGAFEFGYRNGMRPRGLLVYTDEEPGGALTGEMRFRGMRFTPPPGHQPMRIRFELEHVDEPGQ